MKNSKIAWTGVLSFLTLIGIVLFTVAHIDFSATSVKLESDINKHYGEQTLLEKLPATLGLEQEAQTREEILLPKARLYIIALLVATLSGFLATGYFLFHLFSTRNLTGEKVVGWVLVLTLAGFIGNPIYWYVHFYKAGQRNIKEDGLPVL